MKRLLGAVFWTALTLGVLALWVVLGLVVAWAVYTASALLGFVVRSGIDAWVTPTWPEAIPDEFVDGFAAASTLALVGLAAYLNRGVLRDRASEAVRSVVDAWRKVRYPQD